MTATAKRPRPATASPPCQVDDFAEVLYMGASGTALVDAQLLSVARYGPDRWVVVAVVSAPREAFHLVPAGTAEPTACGVESGGRHDADPASASLRPCPPPGGQRPDRT